MSKKYSGKTTLNKFMEIVIKTFPSKEITKEETKELWDSIDVTDTPSDDDTTTEEPSVEVAPDGELSNWDYTLDDTNGTVTLNQYINETATDVTVYGKYQLDGKVYNTKIASNDSNSYDYMFDNKRSIQTITFKEGINTSETLSMSYMFYGCQALTRIWGLENLDTSNVTSMRAMFYWCTSLDFANNPVLPFNTSNVTIMLDMFANCSSLQFLDLTNFDTSNVTDMDNMFMSCTMLHGILVTEGKWVTEQASTASMFANCAVSELTYVA